MIARIRGILDEVDDQVAFVSLALASGEDSPSLTHEILIPQYLRGDLLTQLGQVITLHTLEHLEPLSQGSSFVPRLFGFASARERRFFLLFTTVKGVGMRRALRAMAARPEEIARAIDEKDSKALVALPEIGRRLADTIIAELSGKVDEFAAPSGPGAASGRHVEVGALASEPARRAMAALIRLGESEREAQALVERAIGDEAAPESADELVALALAAR